MTARGWIAREQILGEEARARWATWPSLLLLLLLLHTLSPVAVHCLLLLPCAHHPLAATKQQQRCMQGARRALFVMQACDAANRPNQTPTLTHTPRAHAGCRQSLWCRALTPPTLPLFSCCWSGWRRRWMQRPLGTSRLQLTQSSCAQRGPACAPGIAGSTPRRWAGSRQLAAPPSLALAPVRPALSPALEPGVVGARPLLLLAGGCGACASPALVLSAARPPFLHLALCSPGWPCAGQLPLAGAGRHHRPRAKPQDPHLWTGRLSPCLPPLGCALSLLPLLLRWASAAVNCASLRCLL